MKFMIVRSFFFLTIMSCFMVNHIQTMERNFQENQLFVTCDEYIKQNCTLMMSEDFIQNLTSFVQKDLALLPAFHKVAYLEVIRRLLVRFFAKYAFDTESKKYQPFQPDYRKNGTHKEINETILLPLFKKNFKSPLETQVWNNVEVATPFIQAYFKEVPCLKTKEHSIRVVTDHVILKTIQDHITLVDQIIKAINHEEEEILQQQELRKNKGQQAAIGQSTYTGKIIKSVQGFQSMLQREVSTVTNFVKKDVRAVVNLVPFLPLIMKAGNR